MSFPQLGYPQYLSAAGPGAYGGERPGVLAAAAAAAAAASSGRPGAAELGAGAGAAAVTSVLGMYAAAGPYAGAPNYSAFLPYAADLSLFSQMVSAPGPLSRAALRRRDPGARAEGAGARAGRASGPVRLGGGGGERREAGPVTARPVGLGKRGDGRPGPRGVGGGVPVGVGRPTEQARGQRTALKVGTNSCPTPPIRWRRRGRRAAFTRPPLPGPQAPLSDPFSFGAGPGDSIFSLSVRTRAVVSRAPEGTF